MELFGWGGSILLAACGAPQALRSYTQRSTVGISPLFLWMWFLGEVFTLFYVLLEKFSLPLLLNYAVNIGFISVIIYYYYFPKNVLTMAATCDSIILHNRKKETNER